MYNRRSFLKSGGVIGASGLFFIPTLSNAQNKGSNFTWNVLDYGAKSDGKSLNTVSFQNAIDACFKAGGGLVYVPPGVYLCGPIRLKSNITFYLESGAMVKGSPHLESYKFETDEGWGHGSGESERAGLLSAFNAKNVTVAGRGTLDGNALSFHNEGQVKMGSDMDKQYTRQGSDYMHPRFGIDHGPLTHQERPGNLVRFFNCTNILLTGITIQNSPTWTVQFNRCEKVDVIAVGINSHASNCTIPNDDGIDIHDSRYVHISNCDIQTGDDCIAMFGGENITVSNCTLSSKSSGIRVGFAGNDISNCVFQNLTIVSQRGVNICVRSSSSVSNLSFSNLTIKTKLFTGHWWGAGEPIHISAMPWDVGASTLGKIKNILFSNIIAESESGVLIYGSEQSIIENVVIENLTLILKEGSLQEAYGGNFDLRSTDEPSTSIFSHDIPGIFCKHVLGFEIRNVRLEWDNKNPTFFSHAIQCEYVVKLSMSNFEGRQAVFDSPLAAISIRNCNNFSIKNSTAAVGVQNFLSCTDSKNAGWFSMNDLRNSRKPYSPEKDGFTAFANLG